MMINTSNYFETIKAIDVKSLPPKLKNVFEWVKDATDNHKHWNYYKEAPEIKNKIDQYFGALSKFLAESKPEPKKKSSGVTEADARAAAKHLIHAYVERGDTVDSIRSGQLGFHGSSYSAQIKGNKIMVEEVRGRKADFSFPVQSIYNEIIDELGDRATKPKPTPKVVAKKPAKQTTKPKPVANPRPVTSSQANGAKPVERIGEEVKFIKRYAMMHGKEKTDAQLLNLLSGLQKAIVEKRIRKTSPFKKEVEYMQTNLVKLTNQLRKIPQVAKRVAEIRIGADALKHLKEIAGSEKVRLSVNYLKRYIGIQGKHLTKEKAQRLYDTLNRAVKAKKIFADDPFAPQLQAVWKSLKTFLEVAKPKDTLSVHSEVLNGLNETLNGCGCEEKKDAPEQQIGCPVQAPSNGIMNSLDFAKLKFDSLGFSGKWLDLIGDPAPGFRAMVFGKPKMGKSYLCVEFAGYLARHHGDTLYVAREEKLDATLQKKLNDKDVKHRCLYVSDHLPEDLTPYQFIFLDSVSKLKLTPEQLDGLKAANPGKSFIEVYQTTKEGKFRGTNEHQHDVDVVIEVPERGKAVQFGRFNQGGEMAIFDNYGEGLCQEPEQLNGAKKKYDVLSPDGFSIRIGVAPFSSRKKAKEYFDQWKDRFKAQGYYSSVPYGRIPLEDLSDYCQWIEL